MADRSFWDLLFGREISAIYCPGKGYNANMLTSKDPKTDLFSMAKFT